MKILTSTPNSGKFAAVWTNDNGVWGDSYFIDDDGDLYVFSNLLNDFEPLNHSMAPWVGAIENKNFIYFAE